jgi:hypothetical protein
MDPFYSEIIMTLQDFPRQEGNGMEAAKEPEKQGNSPNQKRARIWYIRVQPPSESTKGLLLPPSYPLSDHPHSAIPAVQIHMFTGTVFKLQAAFIFQFPQAYPILSIEGLILHWYHQGLIPRGVGGKVS